MARTKAMAGTKAGGKSTRKTSVLSTTSFPKSGGVSKGNKRKASTGAHNSACKCPVPKLQLPVGEFLTKGGSSKEAAAGAPPPEEEVNMETVEEVAPTTSAAACGNNITVPKRGKSKKDCNVPEGEDFLVKIVGALQSGKTLLLQEPVPGYTFSSTPEPFTVIVPDATFDHYDTD